MFQIAVCDDDKILCAELENILLEMEKEQSREFRFCYIGKEEEVLLEEKKN